MSQQKLIALRRERRKHRVRKKIRGTAERPRLSVFRSSKHIYAQLIDDESGRTLAAASTVGKNGTYGGNVEAAKLVGRKIAEAAKAQGITRAAFDRGPYRFHGRVLALAVAATDAGLVCCNPKNIEQAKAKAEEAAAKPEAKAKTEKKPKAAGKPKS
jgi:large subunit ribosomal protein L18